ncbi:DUF2812 domain-containing protein [Paenalkalicoccus suaedae]|uniref:DUF2812 domain-containing protein n=1 Tax=Paenalkalicoccus suaedae TaxID=2592382 RepID=A0A859FIS4_9BACI|nr:DUF2812 domain-containing protein [Paenalkalicoccus suaedae]QKS72622.1 DUF2812 domain-containing protein [Paenalkalicoccus suaedae]
MREDTVKRRWLWSIDIHGTELWLADLEAQGYRLTHLDAKSSKFVFEKAEPRYATFMIRYKQESLGNDWTEVASDGNWQITRTTTLPSDSETPVFDPYYDMEDRKPIIKRNNKLLMGWVVTVITLLFTTVATAYHLGDLYSEQQYTAMALWYVALVMQMIVFAFGVYVSFLLQARTQELRPEGLDRGEEVKWKVFAWWRVDLPANIERWLEDQEADGWQLYSCGRNVNRFVFKRATPRAVSYSVTKLSNKEESNMSKPGWEHIKNGSFGIINWSVHRAYYDPATEEKPKMLTKPKEKKHVAKTRAVVDGGFSIIIGVTMAFNFYNMLSITIRDPFNDLGPFSLFVLPLSVLVVGFSFVSAFNLIKHYFDTKRAVA